MGKRFLIVSDLHLCDVEEHADGWKAYKSSRFLFDAELQALLEQFLAGGAAGDEQVLVLNGDVIDFDLVSAFPDPAAWPVSSFERHRGLNANAAKSVWKLERVLSQHPMFVAALTDFLLAGHQLIYLMGNHDREFHFPEVRRAFLATLQARAAHLGERLSDQCVHFEPWFYYEPGRLYIEHGQQYDHYTSFRHLLKPTVTIAREERLALPMGNLSNRYLLTKMGYFNPHASDYILNVFTYAWHWLKYYALSRRSLVSSWLWGSVVVMLKLLHICKKLAAEPKIERKKRLMDIARRLQVQPQTIHALQGLQRLPITSRFFRIMREFWIDRVIFAALWIGGTIALALAPIPLWIKLMVPLTSFPLLLFIYEKLVAGETIFTIESRVPTIARTISTLLPVRVVTFGHTHVPRLIPLRRDVLFVDTGTWAPIFEPNSTILAPGYRNYLTLYFDDEDQLTVHFDSWLQSNARGAGDGASEVK